jgi:hypothetical protein
MELIELAPAESTAAPAAPVMCTADLAECTCPEFCERDHDNDSPRTVGSYAPARSSDCAASAWSRSVMPPAECVVQRSVTFR